jgi:hypothetical protein
VSKKKATKATRRKKSRALPLVSGEPKLHSRPSTSRAKNSKVRRAPSRGLQARNSKALPTGSPWDVALRQQALFATSFSSALRIQVRMFRMWLGLGSPSRDRQMSSQAVRDGGRAKLPRISY